MRQVLVDQGNAVKIMYPDLYKGLNLKFENLTAYESPLVKLQGKDCHSKRPDQVTHTN